MPTALITGASVGIGRELARLFARDGYDLILVARDEVRLNEAAQECRSLSGRDAHVLVADLARPHAAREILERVQAAGWSVNVLVNNAGFGLGGTFAELPLDRQLDMIQVNVTALVELTHLFLPVIRTAGGGGVLNVASTAAFQPGPWMAIYYATKAFVLSFSEALAEELSDAGLTVTALCPGPTSTEFQKRAGLSNARMFETTSLVVASAASVARAGYEGFRRGRRVVVPGVINKIHTQSVRFGSRRLVAKLAAKVNQSK